MILVTEEFLNCIEQNLEYEHKRREVRPAVDYSAFLRPSIKSGAPNPAGPLGHNVRTSVCLLSLCDPV